MYGHHCRTKVRTIYEVLLYYKLIVFIISTKYWFTYVDLSHKGFDLIFSRRAWILQDSIENTIYK